MWFLLYMCGYKAFHGIACMGLGLGHESGPLYKSRSAGADFERSHYCDV
jgi:hypothetical protein